MQTHVTPFFPQDLENYAPWVSKYGLTAPYGECQCGCGGKTNRAHGDRTRGLRNGDPLRYIWNHRGKRVRLPDQAPFANESPGTRLIPLTRDRFVIVDVADYEWLMQWQWHATETGNIWYAYRSTRVNGRKRTLLMHRAIMDAPKGVLIDHKNGNGLDNRRDNLRYATHAQNMRNSCLQSNNSSGFRGVSWDKKAKKWKAYFCVSGKNKYLGAFASVVDAARAYDKAARAIAGEFARLNFPEEE